MPFSGHDYAITSWHSSGPTVTDVVVQKPIMQRSNVVRVLSHVRDALHRRLVPWAFTKRIATCVIHHALKHHRPHTQPQSICDTVRKLMVQRSVCRPPPSLIIVKMSVKNGMLRKCWACTEKLTGG